MQRSKTFFKVAITLPVNLCKQIFQEDQKKIKFILAPEPTEAPFSPLGFFAVVQQNFRVTLLTFTAPWSLTYQPKYSY